MSDVGRYRRLYSNDWHHPAFRRLNDGARIVRLYVGAGPQTTSVGCFRLSTAVAVEDLGGAAEEFERRLDSVCEAFGWAWDPLARVIWMRDFFDMNPPASPNVVAAWAKLIKNVPDCPIKTEAIASITKSLSNLSADFRKPWLELSKRFPRSEVQPEVRSEPLQGTGNRDQRSGSERTGALRAAAEKPKNGNGDQGNDSVALKLARETLKTTDPTGSMDLLTDTMQYLGRDSQVQLTRAQCEEALTIALSERRSMSA
jgi:hypothetical protein